MKNGSPQLSIVIPFFMNATRLLNLINSLNISHEISCSKIQIEIIIVNDSPDFDLNNLIQGEYKDYKSEKIQFKIISNDINRGVAYSRNRGRKSANGRNITFIDQDDYVEPSYFKEIEKVLVKDLDLVILNAYHVWEDNKIKIPMYRFKPKFTLKSLIRNCNIITPGLIIFKNDFLKYEFTCYNQDYPGSDDWALYLNICKEKNPKIYFVEKPIFNYVSHSSNFSKNEINLLKSSILTLSNIPTTKYKSTKYIKLKLIELHLRYIEKKNKTYVESINSLIISLINKLYLANTNNITYWFKKKYQLYKVKS